MKTVIYHRADFDGIAKQYGGGGHKGACGFTARSWNKNGSRISFELP